MLGAKTASSEARMCTPIPASSGFLRPRVSESGPTNSCPSARPMRVPVIVS